MSKNEPSATPNLNFIGIGFRDYKTAPATSNRKLVPTQISQFPIYYVDTALSGVLLLPPFAPPYNQTLKRPFICWKRPMHPLTGDCF